MYKGLVSDCKLACINLIFRNRRCFSSSEGKILQKYNVLVNEKKLERDAHQVQAISQFDNLLSKIQENPTQQGNI